MDKVISFLIENPEVLSKLKEGTVSLLGVSAEEIFAIIEVFGKANDSLMKAGYWVS
ncbi:MAG: competence pheromone ComX [Bacillales bacterium]|jgi:competence protein ComX|nr:competence pheromone ComX [Bacillales bacterium]